MQQFSVESILKELKTLKYLNRLVFVTVLLLTPVRMIIPDLMVSAKGISFWGAIWSKIIGTTIYDFSLIYCSWERLWVA